MDLSIIIVNYNSGFLIKRCIESIIRWTKGLQYEIIVVDNCSIDNSIAPIKDIQAPIVVINNSSNLGFSKASNIGIRRSLGTVVVLLNQDVMLKTDAFGPMHKCITNDPSIGILGCRIVYPDGQIQPSAYAYTSLGKTTLQIIAGPFRPLSGFFAKFPFLGSMKVLKPYLSQHSDDSGFVESDFITGACMMFRKDIVDSVGLLDEAFFMYYEDEDFCRRIKNFGFKIKQYLDVSVVHDFGWGSNKTNVKLITERHKSLAYYCSKYYKCRKIYYAIYKGFSAILFWISLSGVQVKLLMSKIVKR